MINPTCFFLGNLMKDSKLQFTHSKFLLEQGISYIISECFCQDDLENYFGRQRGHRRDNPTVREAGYNDNTIKSQYSVRPIAGNVRANLHKFNIIDETPLPKRKMQRK